MYTRKLFLTLLFLAFTSTFSVVNAGEYPYLSEHHPDSYRSIASSVWTVMGSLVILETEERTLRSFGIKEWMREGFASPEVGDEATLILDNGNAIIDITEPGGKGGFFGNEVTGRVHRFNQPLKWIVIESDQGEMYGFDMKDAAVTKLNRVKKGKKIILAMDGQDRVMDVYRAD